MTDHSDFDDFPGLDALAERAAVAQRHATAMVAQPEIKRTRRWTPLLVGAFGVAAIVALVAVIVGTRPTTTPVSGSPANKHYVAAYLPDNLVLYSAVEGSGANQPDDTPLWLFGDPNDPLGPKTFGVMTGATTAESFDQEMSSGIGKRTTINGNTGYITSASSAQQAVVLGLSSGVTWRVGTRRYSLLAPNADEAELERLAASIDTSSDVPHTSAAGFSPLSGGSAQSAIPLLLTSPVSSSVTYRVDGVGAAGSSVPESVAVLTAQGKGSSLAALLVFGGKKATLNGVPAVVSHMESPLNSTTQSIAIDELSWADSAGTLVSVLMIKGDADKVRKVAEGLKTVDEATWQAMVAKSKLDHPGPSCDSGITSTATIGAVAEPASTALGTVVVAPTAVGSPAVTGFGAGSFPPPATAPEATGTPPSEVGSVPDAKPGSETVVQQGSNGGGIFPCDVTAVSPGSPMPPSPQPSDLPYGAVVKLPNLPDAALRWGLSNNGWGLAVDTGSSSSMSTGSPDFTGPVELSTAGGFDNNGSSPAAYGIAKVGLDIQLMPLSLSDAEASTYTQGIPVTKSSDPPQGGYVAFGVTTPTNSATTLHLVARDATGNVVWSGPLASSSGINSSSESGSVSAVAQSTVPATTP